MQPEKRKPAEVFHVSEFIQEELDARGWTLLDLAKRMSGKLVINLLALKIFMSVHDRDLMPGDLLDEVSIVFGVSPEFLSNLDRAWRFNDA